MFLELNNIESDCDYSQHYWGFIITREDYQMNQDNPYDVGWPFVITLVIIASTDLAIRNSNGCSSPSDLIKGAVLGLFIGIIWWQIIANTTWPGPEYLYFGKEKKTFAVPHRHLDSLHNPNLY